MPISSSTSSTPSARRLVGTQVLDDAVWYRVADRCPEPHNVGDGTVQTVHHRGQVVAVQLQWPVMTAIHLLDGRARTMTSGCPPGAVRRASLPTA